MVERSLSMREVAGSIPASSSFGWRGEGWGCDDIHTSVCVHGYPFVSFDVIRACSGARVARSRVGATKGVGKRGVVSCGGGVVSWGTRP